jgi:hypothetical protein
MVLRESSIAGVGGTAHPAAFSKVDPPSTLSRPRIFQAKRLSSRDEREEPDQLGPGRLVRPRNCASSSSESTSLVAAGAPYPRSKTPIEDT